MEARTMFVVRLAKKIIDNEPNIGEDLKSLTPSEVCDLWWAVHRFNPSNKFKKSPRYTGLKIIYEQFGRTAEEDEGLGDM